MKRLLILAAGLPLAACATTQSPAPEPRVVTITKTVPVAVSCVPQNINTAPAYPDSDEALRAAPDAAERYQLLYAGRKLRTARLGELEPIVDTCKRAGEKVK